MSTYRYPIKKNVCSHLCVDFRSLILSLPIYFIMKCNTWLQATQKYKKYHEYVKIFF